MAVELTTEQTERVDRVLRGLGLSPEATAELREKTIYSLAHPLPPGEVHRICEELRQELGPIPASDGRSNDELVGYDEYGAPA